LLDPATVRPYAPADRSLAVRRGHATGRPGGGGDGHRYLVGVPGHRHRLADRLADRPAVRRELDSDGGIILGVYFAVAAANEFLIAALVEGWKWVHVLLGVLFALGALWAFFQPKEAFWALASILGLLLLLKGSFDLIGSVMTKDVNPLWWLGLVAGIFEIMLAFWASQRYYPARAALILIWVGFMAMFRGITEIVLAFQLRKAGRELAAA